MVVQRAADAVSAALHCMLANALPPLRRQHSQTGSAPSSSLLGGLAMTRRDPSRRPEHTPRPQIIPPPVAAALGGPQEPDIPFSVSQFAMLRHAACCLFVLQLLDGNKLALNSGQPALRLLPWSTHASALFACLPPLAICSPGVRAEHGPPFISRRQVAAAGALECWQQLAVLRAAAGCTCLLGRCD